METISTQVLTDQGVQMRMGEIWAGEGGGE